MLRWYPAAWRDRYGEELVTLMADQTDGRRPPLSMRIDVARAGLRERRRQAGHCGDVRPPAERVRAGALLVLCGWALFVVAGAVFQKSSEHFASALPRTARWPALTAFDVVVVAAVIGLLIVAAGALAALPAFVRFLRGGGWPSVRRLVLTTTLSTATEAGALGALIPWAHSLPAGQRNGGSSLYTAAFLGLALFTAVSVALWTALAVACARRIEMAPRLLRLEVGLAVALFVLMIVVTVSVAVWWGSVGSAAPWFLHGARAGTGSSAFDPNLGVSLTLMLLAVAVASSGVTRILRHRHVLHGS